MVEAQDKFWQKGLVPVVLELPAGNGRKVGFYL